MHIRVERWSEKGLPDSTSLRRMMEEEGYVISEHTEEPGAVHDKHDHSEAISVWVVSGTITLRVGEDEYSLNAGDRDYLPKNTEHSAFVPGAEPVVYLMGAKK